MKGLFTQGLVVLTEKPIPIEELRPLLPEYPFLKTVPAGENWAFGGPSVIIGFRREVNGLVVIDSVDRPWPDHMGDPKTEFTIFGAWSMGHFGPLTFPRGLERAVEQAWSFPEAKATVPRHTSFLRIRLSYAFGAAPDAKCMPQDCNPGQELEFLTGVVRCILKHPAALCYFAPGGEVLLSAQALEDSIAYHRTHDLPPFDLWSNVRLFNLPDDWLLMDSVGNGQLDLRDHEAAFPKDSYEPNEVGKFIRNATLYVWKNGDVIKPGHTMNGPGGIRWRASIAANGVCSPPRETMRWLPENISVVPAILLATSAPAENQAGSSTAQKKPWWRRLTGG